MGRILLIETATRVCSIGLAIGGELRALRESYEQRSHAELITVFIEELLQEAGIEINQIDAVAVSMGPGSYTGLRIGVSTAKGICYALDKPLIAIDTLQGMAYGMASIRPDEGFTNELYCPMIDARRMEVYTAIFEASGKRLTETKAVIIEENTFSEKLTNNKIVFFGDGAEKCSAMLSANPNAIFVDGFNLSARLMANKAMIQYEAGSFVDTAYFEPFYLKDFVAAAPKVKGLK